MIYELLVKKKLHLQQAIKLVDSREARKEFMEKNSISATDYQMHIAVIQLLIAGDGVNYTWSKKKKKTRRRRK